LAVLANRHEEFLGAGSRIFGLSADAVPQNAAVMEKLALPFPLLADPDRDKAITPLGFADEKDARQISRAGTVILAPGGDEVWRHTGRDYADRPHEDLVLEQVMALDLGPTKQEAPAIGEAEAGPTAMSLASLVPYLKGAKFASLALRSRHRELGAEFTDDTKQLVQRVDRYLEALDGIEGRRT
jgi:hypothetical protein